MHDAVCVNTGLRDPNEDVVDVWRFGNDPGHERFAGELPVRIGTERVGAIDLDEVFSRHLDRWGTGKP